MSCRVFKRDLEFAMFDDLVRQIREKGGKTIKSGETFFTVETNERNILKFQVVSEKDKTLRVIKCIDKCALCTFPDSVIYEGEKYTVTEIGRKVFKNGFIKKIVFPATLKIIGDKPEVNCISCVSFTVSQFTVLKIKGG